MDHIKPTEGLIALLHEMHVASKTYLAVRSKRGRRARAERARCADLLAGCFAEVEEWLEENDHHELLRELRTERPGPEQSVPPPPWC